MPIEAKLLDVEKTKNGQRFRSELRENCPLMGLSIPKSGQFEKVHQGQPQRIKDSKSGRD